VNGLRGLCARLDVPLEVERAGVTAIAAEQGDGLEAAARAARYDFLQQVAERIGARYVATAHTADDQVETVLHRVLRGTGIDGLAGIRKARPLTASVALVRPMLGLSRANVIEYLDAMGQDYCTDATNSDLQWTRNRLRHELLPLLRERYNTQVDAAITRLAAQADDTQQLISELAGRLATSVVQGDSKQMRIDCQELAGQPPIFVREVIKTAWQLAGWKEQAMGFHEWQLLARLAASDEAPVLNFPGNIRARREGAVLLLERLAN
jgi:tRNA(Ile)-lysidine synthase